jgi:hypothetical protein
VKRAASFSLPLSLFTAVHHFEDLSIMFSQLNVSSNKRYEEVLKDNSEFDKYFKLLEKPDNNILLWDQPSSAQPAGTADHPKALKDRMLKARDFRRRFGIERLVYKNNDMKTALAADANSPLREEVAKINKAYDLVGWELADQYEKVLARLLEIGYSQEEAKRRADEYIAPIVMAEIKLVKAKHPFALGSGKGKKGPSMTDALYSRLKGASLKPAPKAESGVDLSKVKTEPLDQD